LDPGWQVDWSLNVFVVALELSVQWTKELFESLVREGSDGLPDGVDVVRIVDMVDGVVVAFTVDVVLRIPTGLLVVFVLIRCSIYRLVSIRITFMCLKRAIET
jgi:hypothetical protein